MNALMNVLLDIDEPVSPNHPIPSPTKILKIYALHTTWPEERGWEGRGGEVK